MTAPLDNTDDEAMTGDRYSRGLDRDDEWEVIPPVGEGAPVGRALMLTQQEWDVLDGIMKQYKLLTDPVMRPGRTCNETREVLETVVRSRALAERIIEANQ